MRRFIFSCCFSIWGAFALFAESPSLEMTCEHTVVPEMPEILIYITLHNRTSEPIDVITCLPNAGIAVRGGTWMFSIQSTWYAEEIGENKLPIRKRLLPITIPPHQRITFSQRFFGGIFDNIPQIDKNTYVQCLYKVWDRDAKRYKVWGGELMARSTYVPFYEKK